MADCALGLRKGSASEQVEMATESDLESEDLEVELGSFLTGLGAVIEGVKETRTRMDRVAATRFSVFWYFKRNENIISGGLPEPPAKAYRKHVSQAPSS